MRKALRVIDSISDWTGKLARWFCAGLVLVLTYEVMMRYAFNAPNVWAYETSVMIAGSMYVLFWSYDHRHHAHVRIDVFYTRLSPRGKAVIDVVGTLLFFFPLIILFSYTSATFTWRAWSIGERLNLTHCWFPPVAPLRTAVAIGILLFLLQGVAQFIRDLYLLIRNKAYD